MTSGLSYHKQKIEESLKELSDLTGRTYKVERLESGKVKLFDSHSMFSNGIYADNYQDFRWALNEVIRMIKLSNQWTNKGADQ